ncbi:MAG: S8 family serine peptidase, partial [Flavobacteriaceae bacterium]|nr:S8 family serine peptidase [Flavobacteriaceae bacterium]
MKRFWTLVLLLSVSLASAQTLRRSDDANQKKTDSTKYAKQIKAIVDSYDKDALADLFVVNDAKERAEKQDALAYALVKNIPVKRYNPDGTFDELQKLAADGTPIYYTLHNVNAAISTRANFLNTGGGLGLTVDGNGLTAHVWDGGPTRPTHQEFDGAGGNNRVSINDGVTTLNGNSFHAQHVTGTIVASGVNASAKGMAWQGDALTHDWNSDLTEATSEAGSGMLLSNHSYGYNATAIPDSWFGQYGTDARDWDNLMYNAPYYLQIKSAGNDGNNNTANGSPLDGQSAYDKLNGDACAKNNLVIANGQDASINPVTGALISVNRNSGSSEGPTDDYRIKPDIMGNGTSLTSTYDGSDTAYGTISGTSMSAPNVTGTLLLLQEHYNDINSSFMKAATLKGLALHTADDEAPAGPDAQTGWGLLNAKVAAETITAAGTSAVISELNLSNGGTYQVTIQSDGVNPLMASISWTDPAHTPISGTNNNTPALVNDLDLRLDNGTTFTPWRLTGVTTNGNGDNNVDPFERIDISSASGQYTLTVTHKGSLSSGSQDFSLIVTGGTIAASSPEISYGTTTTTSTEGTDCNFTDVTVPLNIAMAPSQNADVTFAVNGGTATNGVDYEILTPTVTFLQGQTASQNLTVRFYNDGVVESPETAIIDFTVNPNGGDATANPAADSLTITMNDDDTVPSSTTVTNIYSEDFEDWTGWLNLDRDGDTNTWLSLSFTSGGYTGFTGQFPASETDLTVLGGSGKANADNYLVSPQISIPAGTTNTEFTFSVAGYNTIEHYRLIWTTDISSYAAIDAGITLEERDATANTGDIRTINRNDLAGQSGYFVIRHYNSFSNNGLLLFDALEIEVTVETPVQTAVNVGTSNQTDVPGAGTMYAGDSSSGDIMIAINNTGGDDYGCVTTHVSRAGTSAQSHDGSTSPDLVMDKTFNISPANTVSSGATSVTFYFTETEVAGWEAAAPGARANLVAARDDGSSVETSALSIGSFGSHVTLTGTFTGLNGTYYFGPLGAFVACTGVTKTWNGSNWSPAGAPGITDNVIINGNYTTGTDGDLNACTLTINSGNTLTVSAGGYLNVDGDINVMSTGTLDVEHTGSVVQVDPDGVATNSGTITIDLLTPPLKIRDFMIMGSPMTAETRNGVFVNSYNVQEYTSANFLPHPGVPAGG